MKKLILVSIFLFINFIYSQEVITDKKTIILKGQIVDPSSKTPVSFATLILKKEGIYRVADENGFFELPVKQYMIKNASVEISSMGYESQKIHLKQLENIIYLKPKFEELSEVIVTSYRFPKDVLKKAILLKKENHPVKAFNFHRYGKILINKNDIDELDLELISKDHDYGYLSPYIITQRVEQIKWNRTKNIDAYKHAGQFFSYRQNAIRYSSILHKKKYKNFNLNFVKSNDSSQEHLYIISFEGKKNQWKFTNKNYPTKYSGLVYIDKESFAIVKVIENWETTLNEKEIKNHLSNTDISRQFQGFNYADDLIELTIKEENICYYSNILDSRKFYATKYYNSSYNQTLNKEGERETNIYVRDSDLFDFELKNVEEIEYHEFNEKKENSLRRVSYDENFWSSFYQRQRRYKAKK